MLINKIMIMIQFDLLSYKISQEIFASNPLGQKSLLNIIDGIF